MGDIANKVDEAYRDKSVAELADAPVDALLGVSDGDAQRLKDAFTIKAVRDLGTDEYFLWAQSIAKLGEPGQRLRPEWGALCGTPPRTGCGHRDGDGCGGAVTGGTRHGR